MLVLEALIQSLILITSGEDDAVPLVDKELSGGTLLQSQMLFPEELHQRLQSPKFVNGLLIEALNEFAPAGISSLDVRSTIRFCECPLTSLVHFNVVFLGTLLLSRRGNTPPHERSTRLAMQVSTSLQVVRESLAEALRRLGTLQRWL